MSLRMVVQQPQFLPWIGFWNKMLVADIYVMYAGVQFSRLDHENRVTIGKDVWLTIPVMHQKKLDVLFKDMRVGGDQKKIEKVVKTIQYQFINKKCPYGEKLENLCSLISRVRVGDPLLDILVSSTLELMKVMGLNREFHVDTEDRSGSKTEKLNTAILKYAEGREVDYFAGRAGMNYMGFHDLPVVSKIMYQVPSKGMNPHSILQLIATVDDPTPLIEQSCGWLDANGITHSLDKGSLYVTESPT